VAIVTTVEHLRYVEYVAGAVAKGLAEVARAETLPHVHVVKRLQRRRPIDFEIVWTQSACAMLLDALDFVVSRFSPLAADQFVDEVLDATEIAATYGEHGQVVPEVDHDDVREISVGAYRLQYHLDGDRSEIVAVCRREA
jgi:toxin ParE1/3/4